MNDVLAPNPVLLDSFTTIRRIPTRPTAFRDANFDREFDDSTLFFDAFHVRDRACVVLLGPPFFNLAPAMAAMKISAWPSGESCSFECKRRDRNVQIWVAAPTDTARLHIRCPLGAFDVVVGEDFGQDFEGLRTIFTMSRNNQLEWILDWARYNRDIHGAQAILLYDNNSDAYTGKDVLEALSNLGGFERIRVVSWPFKFGPQGLDRTRFWDSDFCQFGAWEHMRWRFTRRARSVMNSDIDELVVTRSGKSVFELAETSRTGILRYHGRWVIGVEGAAPRPAPDRLRRHRDYTHVLKETLTRSRLLLSRDANRCVPKWTLTPNKCPDWAQWAVHKVKLWWPSYFSTREASFRHFREISDSWKYDRMAREEFARAGQEFDSELARAFERVDWER
jgi:hypothetical protein